MNRKPRRADEQQGSAAMQAAVADAVRHHRAGRLNEAAASYRRAIDATPYVPELHNNLGHVLTQQGRLDEAAAGIRRAIDLRPDFPQAHYNLGIALAEQGMLNEAIACYQRAIDLQPQIPQMHNSLGYALAKQGMLDAAVACYHRAIALNPTYPEAHNNLGHALGQQGRLDGAIACYRRAIDLRQCYQEARNNLGAALAEQRRLDAAVACYRGAIDLDPSFAEAHFNLAIALLAQGDMAAGWQEYEWRWRMPEGIKACRIFAQPQWRGEPAAGRTLLIHAEQGFGDTLQFCRYGPLAAARGMRVIMQVPKPLVRALRLLPGVDLVVGPGEALPAFDLHCPMLSMPLAMGTTIETIPSAAAYLHADAVQVAAWRMRLAALDGPMGDSLGDSMGVPLGDSRPRIGLVWAGAARTGTALAAVDRRRSLSADRLAPLLDLPGLHFFSLQKGDAAATVHPRLTDFMDEMGDFADTASLIANLDLIISVDTAVAHLAAALGKPVWLLDRFDACWRWLIGRRDSPWYPTLRLYRQPRPGDWAPVLAEVARDLRSLAIRTAA
jgi:tetratricopeptide (TPR) repeat protein